MPCESQPNRIAVLVGLMASVCVAVSCGGGAGQSAVAPPPPAPAPPPPAPPPPPPPPALTGTAALSWTSPTGVVSGYRVYYGTASRGYEQALGSGIVATTTTFTVADLPSGRTYYFAVTAINATGVESAYSNEATKLIP